MKIVFFGTPNIALPILEILNKQHEVLSVVTRPDVPVGRKQEFQESPVSALAKDLNLRTFKPETVKGNPEFLEQLRVLQADIFVVVAYGKILPLEIIDLPKYKTVNVHFSVLPKYRGPSPIQTALLHGEKQTGVSFFLLDEKMDTGPLIGQEIVNIDPDDNYFTLSDKLAHFSAKIICTLLDDYAQGKITPLPQDREQASYTKIITKEDGKIDWSKSVQEIYDQFRAFYLWPGIWTTWNGRKLKIIECIPGIDPSANTELQGAYGSVLAAGGILCGNGGILKVKRLQLEGKAETDIQSFLNGYGNFVGSQLGL